MTRVRVDREGVRIGEVTDDRFEIYFEQQARGCVEFEQLLGHQHPQRLIAWIHRQRRRCLRQGNALRDRGRRRVDAIRHLIVGDPHIAGLARRRVDIRPGGKRNG